MEGKTQETAAAMAGMCVRSARKWQDGPLPSETKEERWWRTRSDPFDGVWDEEIEPLLRGDPKGKPLRHQLHRTPTATQQARWEAVQQAKGRGLSLRAIARELGMSRVATGKYALADSPLPSCSAPRSGPRPRPWSNHRWPPTNLGDIFAFQNKGRNRWTTTV